MPNLPICLTCSYRCLHDDDHLQCHRHAPMPGDGEFEVVAWPVVSPGSRCGKGSIGTEGEKIVRCEGCAHWYWPEGGVAPDYLGWRDEKWWSGSGLCLLRAPGPSIGDSDEVFWRVTHYTDGCGDGVVVEKDAVSKS